MTKNTREEYQKAYQQNYHYTEKRKRVSVSLSPQEYKQLAYLAGQRKQKPTRTATDVIHAFLDQDPLLSKPLETELQEIKRLIRNVANNVNQVAHRSNYLQVMVDEHELLSQIQRLETIVNDFVKGKMGQWS